MPLGQDNFFFAPNHVASKKAFVSILSVSSVVNWHVSLSNSSQCINLDYCNSYFLVWLSDSQLNIITEQIKVLSNLLEMHIFKEKLLKTSNNLWCYLHFRFFGGVWENFGILATKMEDFDRGYLPFKIHWIRNISNMNFCTGHLCNKIHSDMKMWCQEMLGVNKTVWKMDCMHDKSNAWENILVEVCQ